MLGISRNRQIRRSKVLGKFSLVNSTRNRAVVIKQAQASQERNEASTHRLTELQWELQHAWHQSQQADQAQKVALQAAQHRIAGLEADKQQAGEAATRVQQAADQERDQAASLLQEIADTKVDSEHSSMCFSLLSIPFCSSCLGRGVSNIRQLQALHFGLSCCPYYNCHDCCHYGCNY